MKDKIKEVQEYFKNKLLTKDFTITSRDEYTMIVLIDDEFELTIWIGNWDIPEVCKPYDRAGNVNFIYIPFSDLDAIQLHDLIDQEVKKDERIGKEIARLQEELKKKDTL